MFPLWVAALAVVAFSLWSTIDVCRPKKAWDLFFDRWEAPTPFTLSLVVTGAMVLVVLSLLHSVRP